MLASISLPQIALGIGSMAAAGSAIWAGNAKLKERRDKKAAARAALAEAEAAARCEAAERERLAREARELQSAQEAERRRLADLKHIRDNPADLVTKIIGEANSELAEIEGVAAAHDRAAALAQAQADEALAECPNGVLPSAKDMKTIALKSALWLTVTVISLLLLFQLMMGITNNAVISAIIAPLFVALLEGGSFWLNSLIEGHKAKLVSEARFRLSAGLTVAALLVFGVFTCYFSSIRAENANAAERLRLQNVIATLEADALTTDLSEEDALVLAVDKEKLNGLQSRIEQETVVYAVAECLALPAERWLGMALPIFLSINKLRRRYETALAAMRSSTERAEQERSKADVLNAQTWERLRATMWEAGVPFETVGIDAPPCERPASAGDAQGTDDDAGSQGAPATDDEQESDEPAGTVHLDDVPDDDTDYQDTPDPDALGRALSPKAPLEQGSAPASPAAPATLLSTIHYAASAGGSVYPESECIESPHGIAYGSDAVADAGYKFVNWTDNRGVVVWDTPDFVPSKSRDGTYEDGISYIANFRVNTSCPGRFDPQNEDWREHGLAVSIIG